MGLLGLGSQDKNNPAKIIVVRYGIIFPKDTKQPQISGSGAVS